MYLLINTKLVYLLGIFVILWKLGVFTSTSNGKSKLSLPNSNSMFPNIPNTSSSSDDGLNWRTNIDVVIAWSGNPKGGKNNTDVARDRNNNELPYLLRSIAANAPWVRKIWIIINSDAFPVDPIEIPASLKTRTLLVDRCLFMPNGTCPTRNSFSVAAFSHRTPGLAEHYILADDDTFLGRPVKQEHFFSEGLPFVWRKAPTWGYFQGQEFHRIYWDPSVASFPTPNSTAPSPHFWFPQLKSVCSAMVKKFPQFYAFVASHTQGRYSSEAKGPNDDHNSQEEDFLGWINWEYLREGTGVYKNIDDKRYEWWDEADQGITEEWFKYAVEKRPIFINVNDRYSSNATIYGQQTKWFHEAMEKLFPK